MALKDSNQNPGTRNPGGGNAPGTINARCRQGPGYRTGGGVKRIQERMGGSQGASARGSSGQSIERRTRQD